MMPHGISKGLCYKLSFWGILVTAWTFVRFPINTNNFELNLKKKKISQGVMFHYADSALQDTQQTLRLQRHWSERRVRHVSRSRHGRLKIQYRPSHSISQPSYFSSTNQIHRHDLWGILNVYIHNMCHLSNVLQGEISIYCGKYSAKESQQQSQ